MIIRVLCILCNLGDHNGKEFHPFLYLIGLDVSAHYYGLRTAFLRCYIEKQHQCRVSNALLIGRHVAEKVHARLGRVSDIPAALVAHTVGREELVGLARLEMRKTLQSLALPVHGGDSLARQGKISETFLVFTRHKVVFHTVRQASYRDFLCLPKGRKRLGTHHSREQQQKQNENMSICLLYHSSTKLKHF